MSETDEKYLLEAWDKNICPTCGKSIPERGGTGLGRKKDGRFCSLDCLAKYHGPAMQKRHEQRLKRKQREEN